MMKEENWICTDPSCNQYRKKISKNRYEFKEDRIINPITKETEEYRKIINLNDYSKREMIEACDAFGYFEEDFSNDIKERELIAEFLFELSND